MLGTLVTGEALGLLVGAPQAVECQRAGIPEEVPAA